MDRLPLALAAALLLAGACTAPNPDATSDEAPLSTPDAGAEDLRRTAGPDLRHPAAADLAEVAPDLAHERVDLSPPPHECDLAQPAPDLSPACGHAGEPCCPGAVCSGSALCLVDGLVCGNQPAHLCVEPVACGVSGLPPCNDLGNATAVGGRCAFAFAWVRGECAPCYP